MQEYKILVPMLVNSAGVELGKEGDVIELVPNGDETKSFLEGGAIEAVPATEEVDHEVTQADLDANPDLVTEGVKVGDVIKLPVMTDPEEIAKAKAEYEAAEAVPSAEAATPKKYYRGSLIISEEPRTVGAQTFQHIKTVEAHDFDLTEDEYKKDVTISK